MDEVITVMAPPTPVSPSQQDTLKSVTAFARFEFEPGRGNEGTKILMVEWSDSDKSRTGAKAGSWQVSWSGKKTTFSTDENRSTGENNHVQRLYFLLPPGTIIPSHITIAYSDDQDDTTTVNTRPVPKEEGEDRMQRLSLTPLPAIFTPELGATAKASGKKGVLHTIWAKRRLQVLEREIRREEQFNPEGVALDMAVAEKSWIEQNFGIAPPNQGSNQKPQGLNLSLDLDGVQRMNSPPSSPRSPGSPGGRSLKLSEKLKGLNINTGSSAGPNDKTVLTANRAGAVGPKGNTPTRETNPLSPEVGDMAYSSFSAFRDRPPSTAARTQQTTSASHPSTVPNIAPPRKMVAQVPPDFIRQQQPTRESPSIESITFGQPSVTITPGSRTVKSSPGVATAPGADSGVSRRRREEQEVYGDDDDDEEEDPELFAVALSPRSPDYPKSPFSMSSDEVEGGLGGNGGRGAFSKIKGEQAQTRSLPSRS